MRLPLWGFRYIVARIFFMDYWNPKSKYFDVGKVALLSTRIKLTSRFCQIGASRSKAAIAGKPGNCQNPRFATHWKETIYAHFKLWEKSSPLSRKSAIKSQSRYRPQARVRLVVLIGACRAKQHLLTRSIHSFPAYYQTTVYSQFILYCEKLR